MATLSKQQFSVSEAMTGRRFVVTGTMASAANVFHKVPTTAGIMDECWVYAHNFSTQDVDLTVCWGLTAIPSSQTADVSEGVTITIPFHSGRACIFDGVILGKALSAAAYASSANAISIDGFVNRITP